MIEIHNIHLDDKTFDEMIANLQNGGVFIHKKEGGKNIISLANPSDDEIKFRIIMLKKRFDKFKENQQKLGIKEISFDYIGFEKQLNSLSKENDKIILENAEKTMQKLEDDVNLVSGFINPQKATKKEMQDYIKKFFSALDNETKALVIEKVKQLEK